MQARGSAPLSPRMIFHEIVRSRKLVKNGATTRNSSRFFWRPPLNAMAYASGYAIRNVSSVAAPAYTIERP